MSRWDFLTWGEALELLYDMIVYDYITIVFFCKFESNVPHSDNRSKVSKCYSSEYVSSRGFS